MLTEAMYKGTIERAQAILTRYLAPGGPSKADTIQELLAELDSRDLVACMRGEAAVGLAAEPPLSAERAAGAERNPLHVPGVMHCARCKFVLTRTNLYVGNGTTGPGGNETEPCPNGCGPLWPMTWEQWARDAAATSERFFNEIQQLRAQLDERAAESEQLRAAVKRAITWLEGWASAEPILASLRESAATGSPVYNVGSQTAEQQHGRP